MYDIMPLIIFMLVGSLIVGIILADGTNKPGEHEKDFMTEENYSQEDTLAPVRSFPARIVSKSKSSAKTFRYYITFALPDGSEKKELEVDEKTYFLIDMYKDGTLLFRQDRFFCFVPDGKPLPVTYPQDTQLVYVLITRKRREKVRSVCTMRFETPEIPRLELDVDPQTFERFSEGEIGELFCHNSEFRGFAPQEDSAPAPFEQGCPAQDDSEQTPLY